MTECKTHQWVIGGSDKSIYARCIGCQVRVYPQTLNLLIEIGAVRFEDDHCKYTLDTGSENLRLEIKLVPVEGNA